MASLAHNAPKGKKKKLLREARIVTADYYDGLELRVELIRQLVPLGLMQVSRLLQDEVTQLGGVSQQHRTLPPVARSPPIRHTRPARLGEATHGPKR